MSRAYDLGARRYELTGHAEPTDKDYDWLARVTDGEIQTDADEIADFDAGMADAYAKGDTL